MHIDRRRAPRTRPPGRKRPNYTLRRIVAVLAVVLVFFLVSRLISAVVSLFDSGRPGTASTQGGPSPSPSVSPPLVPPPSCTYGKKLASFRKYDEWQLTLLDTNYRLPRSYVPPGLVRISEAGFKGSAFVRGELIEDLTAMRKTAVANGTPIDVAAAYRSFDQQASLFERRVKGLGRDEALEKTARAGHSEHQLGTAVDFKTAGQPDVSEKWDQTPTGRWVVRNAWRFGFVQSYPKGKDDLTCYGHEPWHYRYLGRTLADRIHETGLTLREFLWNEQQAGSAPIP